MESATPVSIEKRREADFPAELVEKPKDVEKGEGVPQDFQEAVRKALGKGKKSKKS